MRSTTIYSQKADMSGALAVGTKPTMSVSTALFKSSKTASCNSFLSIGSKNLNLLPTKGQNLSFELSCFDKRHSTPAGSLCKHIKSTTEDRNIMVLEPPILADKEEDSTSAYSGRDGAHQHEEAKLPTTSLKLDTIIEAELKENGLRSIRRTNLVCTIGPACCTLEQLDSLALAGMNIARLNMRHGTKEWHANVIHHIRKLNEEKGYSVAVMLDMEGGDVHVANIQGTPTVNTQYNSILGVLRNWLAVRCIAPLSNNLKAFFSGTCFVFRLAEVVFSLKGGSTSESLFEDQTLEEDWTSVDFGIHESVDFIALPFATSHAIKRLKSYILARASERSIRVVAKIEGRESLESLEDTLLLSDGVMVARGALGTQISLEQVPSVQQKIVNLCRQLNRPIMVASQLLDSMTQYPTPTRAEVADVSDLVRQQVDALMLSGESAMGQYPCKSLGVLRTVSLRMEDWCRKEKLHECIQLEQLGSTLFNKVSEEICNSAALMANELKADAIFVFTKQGYMASLLSRNRPECPIFAFTNSQDVKAHLNLLWGITPFILHFSEDMETNLEVTLTLLRARSVVKEGNLIIVVSDLAPSCEKTMVESVQIRRVG
eukprot:c14101_g1_i1 orf=400-2205(-)